MSDLSSSAQWEALMRRETVGRACFTFCGRQARLVTCVMLAQLNGFPVVATRLAFLASGGDTRYDQQQTGLSCPRDRDQ